jgi:hypothetical protein
MGKDPVMTMMEAPVLAPHTSASELPVGTVAVFGKQPPERGSWIISSKGADKLPAWLDPLVEKLNELLGLEPNWDGRGAPRVGKGSVAMAIEVVDKVLWAEVPPQIVPTPVGGLQLEWHHNEIDIEIEIDPLGLTAEAYVLDNKTDEDEFGPALALVPVIYQALTKPFVSS